eukprot:TRINITY_DN31466_c0_g1_i1.p1 TRINITY_DN31466_c0_g1~~TRINITY_DN31466_c0_g1_i1.p1  ORF type:complete len:933 (+),score=157.65 TRINITY_DN31466_c0_g1_i1:176-2974(+)
MGSSSREAWLLTAQPTLLLDGGAVHLRRLFEDLQEHTGQLYQRLLVELQEREWRDGKKGTYWRCDTQRPEPDVTRVRRLADLGVYPVHQELVRRMSNFFGVHVEGWWVNHYSNGAAAKNMHRDGWGRERGVNITVGASFGSARTLCFEAAEELVEPRQLRRAQQDGDVFAFGEVVNKKYRHGVHAETVAGPRISIILMGRAAPNWTSMSRLKLEAKSIPKAQPFEALVERKNESSFLTSAVRRRWGGQNQDEQAEREEVATAVAAASSAAGSRWRRPCRTSGTEAVGGTGSCIVWLRDDLRLADNPALFAAANSAASQVIPVFIHDTADSNPWPICGAALWWKGESLKAFDLSLRAHCGSALIIRKGRCEDELLQLATEVSAEKVYFNRMVEPWYRTRDLRVKQLLQSQGIVVEDFKAAVLQEPWEGSPPGIPDGPVLEVAPGKLLPQEGFPPAKDHLVAPLKLQDTVSIINADRLLSNPNPCAQLLTAIGEDEDGATDHRRRDPDHFLVYQDVESGSYTAQPLASLRGRRLPAPIFWPTSLTVDDLGYLDTTGHGFPRVGAPQTSASGSTTSDWAVDMKKVWQPGEDAALRRLREFVDNLEVHKRPDRHRGDLRNTSLLSPHLRFGEISAQSCYAEAMRAPAHFRHGFIRRVLWRDLSYAELYRWPDMPVVSQRRQYEEEIWLGTDEQLRRWQRGQTGFPLIDAAMRQLWNEGYINNYLRHVTAGFLIDYLDISWKEGFRWYDYTLVDSDAAINARLWQQGGHSGVSQWNFVLHPVHAAKNADPHGAYVRRWVPELAGMPTEFIHRPWEAPLELLSLGVRLGASYPRRMLLDIAKARQQHLRHVLQVRCNLPETVSPDGTEYLLLFDGSRLLLRTRDDIRQDTEEIIVAQTADPALQRRGGKRAVGFQQMLLETDMSKGSGRHSGADLHIL